MRDEDIARIDIVLHNGDTDPLILKIPRGQIRVDELVPPMLTLFDRLVDLEISTKPISCNKGCSTCCAQLIPLSPAEVYFLYHRMGSLPTADRENIKAKIDHITRALTQAGLPNQLHDIYRVPDFESRYFNLGIPCPFLKDDACGIYANRPFVCRDYNVVSSPSLCADPYANEPVRVKIGVNMGALMTAFCAKLYAMPALPIPLFLFSEWAEKNSGPLNARMTGQMLWDALLNGLAQIDPKASRIQSIRWRYVETQVQKKCVQGTEFEINATERTDLSPLFISLSQGHAAHHRKMIQEMLQKGEIIANGVVLPPTQIPKLLTKKANSENIKAIFQTLLNHIPEICRNEVLIEIGAGDGYLRYLLDLTHDPRMQCIAQRLVETEVSSKIVAETKAKGKHTICLGIDDLPEYFGEAFTPCVISLNVLDLFSQQQLNEHLGSIRRVLKNEGMMLHIMSSAIHPMVFKDLAKCYPDALLLPLYQGGHVGVRITSTQSAINNEFDAIPKTPDALATLFANSPDRYLDWADRITRWFAHSGENSHCLPLDQFSSTKIRQVLHECGFQLLMHEELHTEVYVEPTGPHDVFAGINVFHNCLGALITSSQIREGTDQILEKSTFRVILAKKTG